MRVHHLNCGTMCPFGGRLMDGRGPGPAHLVCHCLLIETDEHGLVLVDTGLGLGDVEAPRPRLSPFFLALDRPRLRAEDTARRQVERLGFAARDVRHIVLTHLDFDHAGGLDDFPDATVHLMATEADMATRGRRSPRDRARFRPQQWGGAERWRRYREEGAAWFGFDCVRDLDGLPPEILLVPLVGHSWGHSGVAVKRPEGWLLHAGDAYFHAGEIDPARPRCPPGLRLYQRMMEVNRAARLYNQRRLRHLARAQEGAVRIICAHDASELAALQRTAQPIATPTERARRSVPAQPVG